MIITKKWVKRLLADYPEQAETYGYATSQTLTSPSSKVILVLSGTQLIIYYLNFFQTKVYTREVVELARLTESDLRLGIIGSDYVWQIKSGEQTWRFRILRKIIPLGKQQGELIHALKRFEASKTTVS